MKKVLVFAAAAAILVCAVAPASAHGLLMDPDGLSVWDQFVDWLTGGFDENGSSYDPNGRL